MKLAITLAAIWTVLFSAEVLAHGKNTHDDGEKLNFVPAVLDKEVTDWGETGDPKKVTRTIEVIMNEEYRFVPEVIEVRKGQTVRILVKNTDGTLHEMVLGTAHHLAEHAKLMKRFPNMEHASPYMAHADEGQTAEMIWKFTKAGKFEFGCLIPGHFEAGMKGVLIVEDDEASN